MPDEDFHIAALKRQRAHLKDVGADVGKLAENAELLRLAGVDVSKLDEEPKAKVPERKSPVEKHVTAESGAKRPGRPKKAEL